MTDHPSTYKAAKTHSEGIDWDDRASLHLKSDGRGVLDGMKGYQRGTLAEMIRLIMLMPESQRPNYVIQKAGDRTLEYGEIAGLAGRPDFPSAG